MFRFQHTEYLIGLAAVPVFIVLYFLVLNWKKRAIRKIGDERLVKEMIKNYSPQKFTFKFILIVAAFAIGVLALANLRTPEGTKKVNRNGIDVLIALDVSKSMLAQDIKPTRLDRAKQIITKLIDQLNDHRIGIVIFAGRAYLQMPLTGDHSAAKMYLAAASPDAVPTQGTVVSDALKMCFAAFNTKEKKYKAVVLISDGEDHDEGALSIAREMAAEGIVIHTVGIGSTGGIELTDDVTNEVKKDAEGKAIITRLNEKELMGIAQEGKGMYQFFTNADDVVGKLNTQLSSMDQRTVTEDALVNYKNYFPHFLFVALFLLLLDLFTSEKKALRRQTTNSLTPAFLFFLITIPAISMAQDKKSLIKKGNEAYHQQKYDDAITNYEKVTENRTAQYNLGNALYKTGKTDAALNAYEKTILMSTSAADKSASFYNKGVVLQNNKKIQECIDAYKNALKLNPEDEDARQNLQKALQQQKQDQQNKQDKKDKEQNKPKENQQQKEQQQKKEEEKNKQPKPPPSKISKQDAEEKLKALLQQEKNLQDKLRKMNTASPEKPEKDW